MIRSTSKLIHQSLQEFNETIQDTEDNLNEQLKRAEQKLAQSTMEDSKDLRTYLKIEADITKNCLCICKDAKACVKSLENQESSLSRELKTFKTTNKAVSQVIHTFGKLSVKKNSDQVLVTTVADVFDVKEAETEDNSMHLAGSMDGKTFRYASKMRYNSRFGVAGADPNSTETGTTRSLSSSETKKSERASPLQIRSGEQAPESETKNSKSSSNQSRKRMMVGDC